MNKQTKQNILSIFLPDLLNQEIITPANQWGLRDTHDFWSQKHLGSASRLLPHHFWAVWSWESPSFLHWAHLCLWDLCQVWECASHSAIDCSLQVNYKSHGSWFPGVGSEVGDSWSLYLLGSSKVFLSEFNSQNLSFIFYFYFFAVSGHKGLWKWDHLKWADFPRRAAWKELDFTGLEDGGTQKTGGC